MRWRIRLSVAVALQKEKPRRPRPVRGEAAGARLPIVDTASRPWPTWPRSAAGFLLRSGSAGFGRSQKDGLPSRLRGWQFIGSRPSTRAQARGSLVAAPFGWGAGMDAKAL